MLSFTSLVGVLIFGTQGVASAQTPTEAELMEHVVSRTPEVRLDNVDTERLVVRRIDVVDADGVIRMTLAGNLPNPVLDGVEWKRTTQVSGIMMRDDRGNENGGWGYNAAIGGPLFALDHAAGEAAGFNVSRNGATNFMLLSRPEERRSSLLDGALLPTGEQHTGVQISMSSQGVPRVSLKDSADRTRLRLTVTAEGYGAIEFLNAAGEVIHTIVPERDQP